jgi:hypothetical protein
MCWAQNVPKLVIYFHIWINIAHVSKEDFKNLCGTVLKIKHHASTAPCLSDMVTNLTGPGRPEATT